MPEDMTDNQGMTGGGLKGARVSPPPHSNIHTPDSPLAPKTSDNNSAQSINSKNLYGGDMTLSPYTGQNGSKKESGEKKANYRLINIRKAIEARKRKVAERKAGGVVSGKADVAKKGEGSVPGIKKAEKAFEKPPVDKAVNNLGKTPIDTPKLSGKASRSEVRQLDIRLSQKQIEAMNAQEQFVLYGGAKGGGKSWFLCIWMFLMALKNRGNKLFFCRRRSVDFTNTTLETWKKSIPSDLYRINEQKKKIFIIPSNSVIDYGGLDDPLLIQSLNSAEYGNIGIDQAEEIEQDSFGMIRGTLRHKLADGSFPNFHVRLTANPAQCWLKDYFILNPQPETRFIPALPTDNPNLPKSYVNNLKEAFKNRPQLLAAYLYGSWDDLAGHDICIQGRWIEEAKSRRKNGTAIKRIIVNDPARFGDDENVIYVMENDGRVSYIVDQIFLEHKSTMDTAGRLAALRRKHDAQIIAVDVGGIGAGVVDALYELKEPVLSINSSSKPTVEHKQGKYFNLRSQLWMEAGERFSSGEVVVDSDITLCGQLASTKFNYTGNGKIQVESKDDIKKRLGRSPDRADAFIMGLFALDYVGRLDDSEYQKVASDYQGSGTLVSNDREEFAGATDDYSGYSL